MPERRYTSRHSCSSSWVASCTLRSSQHNLKKLLRWISPATSNRLVVSRQICTSVIYCRAGGFRDGGRLLCYAMANHRQLQAIGWRRGARDRSSHGSKSPKEESSPQQQWPERRTPRRDRSAARASPWPKLPARTISPRWLNICRRKRQRYKIPRWPTLGKK